jgi:hypothetical protein
MRKYKVVTEGIKEHGKLVVDRCSTLNIDVESEVDFLIRFRCFAF